MPAELRRLDAGWEAASAEPGGEPGEWLPARVPGTMAGDERDWCFRVRFDADPAAPGEEVVLRLGGIATLAEVTLNGEEVLASESMFVAHAVDVGGLLAGENELSIRCRALGPLLRVPRRPRARWRARIADGGLRFFRTTLSGRAPGFAPGPAPVGPWRPVLLERRRGLVADDVSLRPRLDGTDGVLAVSVRLRTLEGPLPDALEVECGGRTATLPAGGGELRIPDVERWWPHTHGEPGLHDVRLRAGGVELARGRVGFRALEPGPEYDVDAEGLALRVNGVPVFARGAVWTPVEPDELRGALEQARDAGLNMLRLAGTGVYESEEFHDLCDELGLLVWQDFMFANFDYPIADEGFRALVELEARQLLARVAGRPSLAVLCGGSEVEQQPAMLGLDPALGRGELVGELLPALAREAGAVVPYVPSAPSGGELPFRFDRGVASYFGVGGYRRPLEDARRAGVRFASECLAFANVPDGPLADLREGVARDPGSEWDFVDVRDHYLALLYGVDPHRLRREDERRYLALSRQVTGEAMAEVFGEWRRTDSPCAGGIVLWLRDLAPGSGWGLVDRRGRAKVALHHLRRALAPVAVWTTDEGLAGIDVHVANDRPAPLAARLRIALYRDLELRVDGAEEQVELPPHGGLRRNVEALLGRFVDASYAYRFGPPGHDLVVASLETDEGLLSQAFRFPTARPLAVEPADRLGLTATATAEAVTVRTRRFAHGVRLDLPGFRPGDDAFSVEPGGERIVPLRRLEGTGPARGKATALNLDGEVAIR